MIGRFLANPSYLRYVEMTLRLHDLIAAGKAESDGADALRDQMDEPWKELSTEEVARVNGLSSDLYMLADDEVFEKPEPDQQGPDTLGIALLEARRRGDWTAILSLLRKGPAFMPNTVIAFLRGLAYLRLGHPEVALLFFDYAARLDPHEDSYRVFSLQILKRLGRYDEALARAKQCLSSAEPSLPLFLHSASEVFRSTGSTSWEGAQTIYVELVALLDDRLRGNDQTMGDAVTIAFGHLLLGACLQLLGRYDEALAAYDASLKTLPQTESVIAKAMLAEQMKKRLFTPPAVDIQLDTSESDSAKQSQRDSLLKIIQTRDTITAEAFFATAA